MLGGIAGASNAWHRKVFDVFGPLQHEVVFEDRVIALRAALLGGIRHIPKPLVKYRRHPKNTVAMFCSHDVRMTRQALECFLCAYRNSASDLETFINKIQPDFSDAARCRRIIRRRIRKLEAYLQIHSGSPKQILSGLGGIIATAGNPFVALKLAVRILRTQRKSTLT
jgi:hypothetical protein